MGLASALIRPTVRSATRSTAKGLGGSRQGVREQEIIKRQIDQPLYHTSRSVEEIETFDPKGFGKSIKGNVAGGEGIYATESLLHSRGTYYHRAIPPDIQNKYIQKGEVNKLIDAEKLHSEGKLSPEEVKDLIYAAKTYKLKLQEDFNPIVITSKKGKTTSIKNLTPTERKDFLQRNPDYEVGPIIKHEGVWKSQRELEEIGFEGVIDASEKFKWTDEAGISKHEVVIWPSGISKVDSKKIVKDLASGRQTEELLQPKDMSVAQLRAEGNRLRFGDNKDYRMQHKAPTADNYATGEDLNNVFPDIYGSQGKQFYGTGRSDKLDDLVLNIIRKMRGKPNKMVTVYRAVPENVNNINAGDFVTLTEQYALDHIGDDVGYKIIKKRVKVSELASDGNSIHEFGYSPKRINNFRKGGMMYEQQMEMFQEGGITLNDEGGKVDATSGNDVPLGGTKEGVADDQPANLSVGEMVLSEDVVRYHGVEKLMTLRDEAKIAYSKMEAMGQLGNADEATIPPDAIFNPGGMPFSIVDLEYIDMDDDVDEAEAAAGMYIQNKNNMQTGGIVGPNVNKQRQQSLGNRAIMDSQRIQKIKDAQRQQNFKPINAQEGTLVPVQQPPPLITTIDEETGLPVTTAADPATIPQVLQPASAAPITTSVPTTLSPISQPTAPPPIQQPTTPLPTIGEFMGGVQSVNNFINETGQIIQIPVVNGRQIYDTPEGFQPYDPEDPQPFTPAVPEEEEAPQEPVETVEERRLPSPSSGRNALSGRNATDVALSLLDSNSTAQDVLDARSYVLSIIESEGSVSQHDPNDVSLEAIADRAEAQAAEPENAILAAIRNMLPGDPEGTDVAVQRAIAEIRAGERAAETEAAYQQTVGRFTGTGSTQAQIDRAMAIRSMSDAPSVQMEGFSMPTGMQPQAGVGQRGAEFSGGVPGVYREGGLVSKPKKKSNKSKRNRMGLAVPK